MSLDELAHEHVIAPKTSVVYFDMLTAPSKKLVWLEESADEPPFEEPAKFNAAMESWYGR